MAELGLLIGTGVQIGGSLYRGYAAKQAGDYNANLARQEGSFTAAQLQRQATEERIAGQRAAFERQHDINKVVASQRAIAAASGAGGLETPGLMDIMGDTIARGEYLKAVDMYGGEQRARGREDQAAAAIAKGNNAASMYEVQGNNAFTGSVLDSIGTAAKGYFEWDKNFGGSTATPRKKQPVAYDPYWSASVKYG